MSSADDILLKEKFSVDVDDVPDGISRRQFIRSTALLGVTGAGLATVLASCGENGNQAAPGGSQVSTAAAGEQGGRLSADVKPGQLDEYYGLWSGGHSGEIRVYGVPSGRELKRIPVFNPDPLTGWGLTHESQALLGTNPDGSLKYTTGDTHHVHGSYRNGTYDGKYFWTNDKIHGRMARIRGDIFETDKITEIPNVQGFHGIFPDKRDPVDPNINYTTRVFCGSEFQTPHPNDGTGLDDPSNYYCVFTCVDAESMELRWQCKVDGNMDLVATSFDGKLAASNQYNTENGMVFAEMMSAERDTCVFFNIERIEKAVAEGRFFQIPGSEVPVVDGTKAANTDPKTAVTCYVPVPKNPHGVNATPDGKYFICSGKLSPTATVIDLAKMLEWFEGKIEDPRATVVGEPEIGQIGRAHV